jgi:gas vesicle protein
MKQYENGSGGGMSFLFGMIVGAVAGAGVALLLAPKSGAELRSDLNESMDTLKDTASRRFREVKDRASAGWSDVQAAAASATKPSADRTV